MVSSNAPEPAPAAATEPVADAGSPDLKAGAAEALSTAELINRLQADRLWLLQQLDAGQWRDLRLDLAALERELGQLLDRAAERFQGS